MMKREFTLEEKLYRNLLFAYLHYDGDHIKAMDKCVALHTEVMNSDLDDDFKKYFQGLWKDQVSKLYEIHQNYASGLLKRFEMVSSIM